jgi:short-subunit dehydrogenase
MAAKALELKNKWALITGASSGIGEVFARQLAAEGMHLILVARREDRLQALATKLAQAYGIHTVVLPTDLSQGDAPRLLYHRVVALGHPVTLLINNAGIGKLGDFHHAAPEPMQQTVMLNMHALTLLTRYFLPTMVQAGEGAVINIASNAAFQPLPSFAVYAASKAYVVSLTEALWDEYRRHGVRFLTVCPGVTETEFSLQMDSPPLKTMITDTPERVVGEAMRALRRGQMTVITGHWSNWLLAQMSRFFPRALVARLSGVLMRHSFVDQPRN